jgi:monoamine oxidase
MLLTDYDVIIVGAGLGGLGAGVGLTQGQSNPPRTVLLEAKDWVGGRCYSNNEFPAPFDYGGQFFHQIVYDSEGVSNNPLFEIYKAQGGSEIAIDLRPAFYQNGTRLPDSVQKEFRDTATAVGGLICNAGMDAGSGAPDVSAADATADLAGQPWYTLTMAFLELALDAKPARLSCLDAWNDMKLAITPDGSPSDRVNPFGMGNFIQQFANGLNIQLSTRVTEIDISDPVIKVTTNRGALTTQALIITVPITLLAAFPPAIKIVGGLPLEYEEAFHNLPFGLVDKVGISFTEDVFGRDTQDNLMVTRYEDTSNFAMGVAKLAGKPMMNLLVGGDLARTLEEGGKPAFQNYAEFFLRETFQIDKAKIAKVDVHPWGTDEFSRGSYSAALPGMASYRKTLQSPIDNRILFAGEAVSSTAHSSLHGAWMTGLDAASYLTPILLK